MELIQIRDEAQMGGCLVDFAVDVRGGFRYLDRPCRG